MNKTDLINAVSAKAGLTKSDAKNAVEAIFNPETGVIAETLKAGGDVRVTSFGTFGVTERAARQGVNPATGEKMQIKASKSPKFKASNNLKSTLN